jgi:hypothetical protein
MGVGSLNPETAIFVQSVQSAAHALSADFELRAKTGEFVRSRNSLFRADFAVLKG